MHKLVYIFIALILIQCESNDSQNSSNSLSDDDQLNHSAQLVEIDPLRAIEKEIIENPNSTNVYLKRALYYKENREYEKAIEDINRALSLAPDVSILQYHKAAILYEYAVQKQDVTYLDESKIYLNNCISEDKMLIEARLLRAKIHLFEEETDECMGMLSDVLRINERVAEAYLIKGMAYEFLENATLAASSYQTAIEVDPDYYDAYIHRGMLADRLGEDKALDYYNSALALEPKSIEAHRNKALHLHFNNQFMDARASFLDVIQLAPDFEEAYFNIGNTYLGQFAQNEVITDYVDSAFHYFSEAYKMNKTYVQAIHNMGVCFEIKGELNVAREHYQKAIDLDNNFQPALDAINDLN
tara:strand:+ start:211 stop:1281 length:1071 start_codon:yes stop_codon:yes gene_type:complete